MKDMSFKFDKECRAFDILKDKLVYTSIVISPNWYLFFQIMCDANDIAIGKVLNLKKDK